MTENSRRSYHETLPPVQNERLRQYHIHLGVPLLNKALRQNIGYVSIPNEPHVFFCRELNLFTNNRKTAQLNKVMVMHGHGIVLGSEVNSWVWRGSGQSVCQTVQVYESMAKDLGWPQVDVVLACRDESFLRRQGKLTGPQTVFIRREIPYIFATSVVMQVNSYLGGCRRFRIGEGVEEMDLEAEKWLGIERWLQVRQSSQTDRKIPRWAKMPAQPYRLT